MTVRQRALTAQCGPCNSPRVIWVILMVLVLGWMFGALFENGVTWAGVIIAVLTAWALVDYAASAG